VNLFFYLPLAAFLAMAGTAFSQQEGPDAISRIFRHNNGQKTYTQKMGGSKEITESVFDKNDILCGVRVFNLDDRGRILSGVIYDGKKNPMGCTKNFFDQQTGQMLKEELYDKQGRNVRVLYYPGALKEARFAKRMVAFNIDPSNPAAAPREVAGVAKPIVPVTKDEDEFEPGLPQGTAAPTAQEAASRDRASVAAPKAPAKRGWMLQRKPGT
jgi:hypothetical protein